jgi:hypothetical protein
LPTAWWVVSSFVDFEVVWIICNEEDSPGFAAETGNLSDPVCSHRLVADRVILEVAMLRSMLVFIALENDHPSLVSHDKVETEVPLLGRVGVRRETNEGEVHLALVFDVNFVIEKPFENVFFRMGAAIFIFEGMKIVPGGEMFVKFDFSFQDHPFLATRALDSPASVRMLFDVCSEAALTEEALATSIAFVFEFIQQVTFDVPEEEGRRHEGLATGIAFVVELKRMLTTTMETKSVPSLEDVPTIFASVDFVLMMDRVVFSKDAPPGERRFAMLAFERAQVQIVVVVDPCHVRLQFRICVEYANAFRARELW